MSEQLDFVLNLIDKITGPAKRMSKALGGVDKQMDRIGKNDAFGKLSNVDGLVKTGKDLVQLSANFGLAANAAAGFSRATRDAFLAPIKEAAVFEQSMSRVIAVTNDFTEAQRDLARQLGRETKFTADESAKAMANLAIAGFSAKEQMQSLAGVLHLDAAAGLNNLSETAEISAGVLRGFGLDASEMTEVGNVLARTFTNSATTLTDLGQTLSFVAPVAKVAGVSLEETAILAGALGDAGIKGTRGGTGLRLILSRLAGTAPQATKAMKALGIRTQDAAGNLLPVTDILGDLSTEFSKLGSAKQVQLATTLFGRVGATPGAQLLNDLSRTTGSIEKMRGALKNTGVTAKSVAQIMEDNLLGDVTKVESAFSSLKITVGDQFTPELRTLAKFIKDDILPPMERWVSEHKTLTKIIGGSVAVIAGVTAVLAGLAATAGTIALILAGLKLGTAGLTIAWASFQLTLAGWLITAGAVAAKLAGAVAAVKGFAIATVFAIRNMVGFVAKAFLPLAGLVLGVTAAWTLAIVTWWDEIEALVAQIPSSFLELGADMAQSLIDGWKDVFGSFDIGNDIVRAIDSVGDFLGVDVGQRMDGPSELSSSAQAAGGDSTTNNNRNTFQPTINMSVAPGQESEQLRQSLDNTVSDFFDGILASQGG